MIPSPRAWGGRPPITIHDPRRLETIDIPMSANPAELLAWDDAFLGETEATGRHLLWFWESRVPFVVVGYGQRIHETVDVEQCQHAGIPILRRRSGGGTVLQGSGCLTYGITLTIDSNPALSSVDSTNRWIMEKQAQSLGGLEQLQIGIDGYTDLTLATADGKRKFSGNAQRRTRKAILFHGTILHGMDLGLVGRVLRLPKDRPSYRGSRSHAEFMTLLPYRAEEIRKAVTRAWDASPSSASLPWERHTEAMEVRYGHPAWHTHREERRSGKDLGESLSTR